MSYYPLFQVILTYLYCGCCSKKKLDRMTMHGGDFRQAGRRQSQEMSLSYLRKLLEDDVHNLSRMTEARERSAVNAGAVLEGDVDSSKFNGSQQQRGDISDAELELLLDREKLFRLSDVNGDSEYAIPTEGEMYDVVVTTGTNLQGIE